MNEKLKFSESHVLYGCDLMFTKVIEKYIEHIDEAKELLILGATNALDNNDERVLVPLRNLMTLQTDLSDLKNRIEKS